EINMKLKEINDQHNISIQLLNLNVELDPDECILAKKDANLSRKLWKKNLICLTLSKAEDFGINFRSQDNFWDIKGTGPRIRDILEPEIFQKAAPGLKNLGLLYIHQLLDKEAKHLLLWCQLKYLRKQFSRGRKAKWFRTTYPNHLSPVPSKSKISEDNRRKEWVIAEETKNSREVRQIIAKGKTRILIEHWVFEEETEGLIQAIHPCTGFIGVLTDLLAKKEKKELPCPIIAFDSKDALAEQVFLQRETRMDKHIEILNLADFEFIKSQQFSVNLALKDPNSPELNLNPFTSYVLVPYWENILIEKPLRTFMKRAFDLWNAVDWRLSKVALALEQPNDSIHFNWSVLWKILKSQNGYRCISLNKSKRISTQIKCLADKLLTFKELNQCRPDIYSDAYCISCVAEQVESQDHLAGCSAYDWQ
ncbi:13631_t:CDS:2, partial [Gigaspora rosea]